MRILQVMAGAAQGGAETAFEDLCCAIQESGASQKIVVRNNNPQRLSKLKSAGLSVETLPFGGALDVYTPWKLKKIIAAYNPQIVMTWMSRASKMTPASKQPKSYLKVSRLGGYYGMKYFKSTDYFITVTEDVRNYLIGEGVNKNKVRQINNFAIGPDELPPLDRKMLDTPEDAFVILSLARYHQVKALDVLIKAAAPIKEAHVWLAGQGPLEAELKQLAKDMGIADRIHFLGWRSDRTALLKAADVCVLPSRFEPFGTTFVQAWSHKTPLVCSTAQGPSQFVRNEEDALVFTIDDIESLTEKLQRLKTDQGLREKLSVNGYQRYLGEFSKEKTVAAYLGFFEEMLKAENISF